MASQFSLLTNRRFLPLFVTQFMGAFNDNAYKNALVMLLTYGVLTYGDFSGQMLVTLAAGLFILPFFLLSATAGQLADRYDKARIVYWVKLAECLLMIVAAYAFYAQSFLLLMGLLFLMGVHSAFFGPIKYSIVADHLDENELVGGNALLEAGTFLAILIGTIAGGVLIMTPGGTLWISVLLVIAAAAGFVSALRILPALPRPPYADIDWNIARATCNIMCSVRGHKDVYLSIVGISWFWLIGFTFLAQFPVFTRDVLHGDEGVVTLLLVLFSVGIAIGSMLCNRLLKGQVSGIYVPAAAGAMSLAMLVIWFWAPADSVDATVTQGVLAILGDLAYWPSLLGIVMLAVAGGVYIVPLYAIMQTRSDPASRARTVAANNIINALFMVLASLAMAMMTWLGLSVTGIFLAVALINIPVTIIVRNVVTKRRSIRLEQET